ncbi:mediator of RNA polymerase II transcription subunit 21 [Lepidopterella palustris CBS 459.81]|uniref:Mediator of RNA polymerase II transcription subunit 21 n=1 Tax=Lepidopterella palustris CBS 459.81 TaxID=1314670 RepID=A0A8E2JEF9_9PEZI|nr:mediator of RNA polymerase II transcription subunit 21 [Lepidopterella palustris CBS 459.81]
MADRLTQLQDCLDQLATQMYATISYTSNFSSPSPIPGQPLQSPDKIAFPPNAQDLTQTTTTQTTTQNPTQPTQSLQQTPEERHTQFLADLHELSRDLIVKEQQIELIIDRLPGIGHSEAAQKQRMTELERELREIEVERVQAVREKERLVERIGGVVLGIRGLS